MIIEAILIVLALAAVVFAIVRPRDQEPPPATMESGHSHMRSRSD